MRAYLQIACYWQKVQQKTPGLYLWLVGLYAMVLLAGTACVGTPIPAVSPVPTGVTITAPTTAPTPTLPPARTPAPTPQVATALLHVRWPAPTIPILPPQPIEVALVAPPGVVITANVLSSVLDPTGERYGLFVLKPSANPQHYVSEVPLQLPLQPLDGEWRLAVAIQANIRVTGDQVHKFKPAPLSFCVLTDTLHAGVNLSVPRVFEVVHAQGDPWAGGRVWRYQGGEVALWWAPGPLEPLLYSNALVMLETTHTVDVPPTIQSVEETLWPSADPDFTLTAFLFREIWPGPEGGPADAYVIQGPDHWLYVLRMRAVGRDTIPPLIRQVGRTLTFSD